jgi:hypothetical protein
MSQMEREREREGGREREKEGWRGKERGEGMSSDSQSKRKFLCSSRAGNKGGRRAIEKKASTKM